MDPFVGEIRLFPFDFAPRGWEACEGQVLPLQQNMALFSLIGARFGGDGERTFALPNLKGKEPSPNMHYCIALIGKFPERQWP
jgi:microcystin-dependent protein